MQNPPTIKSSSAIESEGGQRSALGSAHHPTHTGLHEIQRISHYTRMLSVWTDAALAASGIAPGGPAQQADKAETACTTCS